MIRVRRALPQDIPALVPQQAALARHQGDQDDLFTPANAERDLFGPAAVGAAHVAEDSAAPGRLLCFAMTTIAYEPIYGARGTYITALWVEPEARRRGVARALIAALAREVKARGDHYLWWVSKSWNSEAHAFYRTLASVEDTLVAHAVFGDDLDRIAGHGADN